MTKQIIFNAIEKAFTDETCTDIQDWTFIECEALEDKTGFLLVFDDKTFSRVLLIVNERSVTIQDAGYNHADCKPRFNIDVPFYDDLEGFITDLDGILSGVYHMQKYIAE